MIQNGATRAREATPCTHVAPLSRPYTVDATDGVATTQL